MKSESDLLALDLFSSGVPPGAVLRLSLDGLRKLVSSTILERSDLNVLLEISFVGAVSYLEAFFKDHFSSIINICPDLVRPLVKSRPEISIDPTKLLEIAGDVRNKLGFLVAEQLDFGTPQKINAIYSATLNLTPFSKKEVEQFSNILRDRNLLVHHGGVYTSGYLKQLTSATPIAALPFRDSKVMSREEVISLLDFAESIAQKILKASKATLKTAVEEADPEIKQALELLDFDFDEPDGTDHF